MKIGSVRTSTQYSQECILCHRLIAKGATAKCGALNFFSEQAIWMHPLCADFVVNHLKVEKLIDNGWRQATNEFACGGCGKKIAVGRKFYHVWPKDFDGSDNFNLSRVCHTCWQVDQASYLEENVSG